MSISEPVGRRRAQGEASSPLLRRRAEGEASSPLLRRRAEGEAHWELDTSRRAAHVLMLVKEFGPVGEVPGTGRGAVATSPCPVAGP